MQPCYLSDEEPVHGSDRQGKAQLFAQSDISQVLVVSNEKAAYDQTWRISQRTGVPPNNNCSWPSQPEDLCALWKEDG
jgi:hypothetical protein